MNGMVTIGTTRASGLPRAMTRTTTALPRAQSSLSSPSSTPPLAVATRSRPPPLSRRRPRPKFSLSSSPSPSHTTASAAATKDRPFPLGVAHALSSRAAGGDGRGAVAREAEPEDERFPPRPRQQRWRWDESDDALRAYSALAALLFAGAAASALDVPHASLPYFIGIASITIYVGAHRGLTAKRRQDIGLKESALLPLGAAFTLGCVYIIVTFFKDLDLSALLDAYFFVLSAAALFGAAAPPLRRVFDGVSGGVEEKEEEEEEEKEERDGSATGSGNKKSKKSNNPGLELPLPPGLFLDEDGESVASAELRLSDAAALALALSVAAGDLAAHHQNFTLSNACAAAVAADVLQLLGLRSFRAAALLLGGLALYDVLAVFASGALTHDGNSVMMTVATAATGPTRLLFPRSAADLAASAQPSPFPFSLLGLGDVAIPGLLACLALKYDASRSVDMNARATAAARAIDGALAELSASNPMAGDREYGEAAADAASAAFEAVAEAEARARDATSVSSASTSMASSTSPGSSASESSRPQSPVIVTEAILGNRRYFSSVMGAYAAGLAVAFAVNAATGAGQPALLYLCPACLGAVAATAARRKEVERIASYTVAAGKPLFVSKKKKKEEREREEEEDDDDEEKEKKKES